MTGKTHQVFGLTVGLGVVLLQGEPQYAPATFAAAAVTSSLAALLPDLDRSSASIWNALPLGNFFGRIVDPLLSHRNISHSLLGLGLFIWGFWSLVNLAPGYWGIDRQLVVQAFAAAYASHLLADAVTVAGIPIFFPYQKMFGFPPRPFEGLRIITGKWFENLVVFPLFNLLLIGLVVSQWRVIRTFLFR